MNEKTVQDLLHRAMAGEEPPLAAHLVGGAADKPGCSRRARRPAPPRAARLSRRPAVTA